jgi:hypothetical protein
MRTITRFFRWALGLVMLLGIIACGSGELDFSEESMMSDYEQGRSDKDPDLGTRFDPACADLNVDGCVDVNDLNALFGAWGTEIACIQACGCPDINADGRVDGPDLSLLLAAWGYGESCNSAADDNTDVSDADSNVSLSDGGEAGEEDKDEDEDDNNNKKPGLTISATGNG